MSRLPTVGARLRQHWIPLIKAMLAARSAARPRLRISSRIVGADFTANLVARTGVTAVSLDYRLVPQHQFRAASTTAGAANQELL